MDSLYSNSMRVFVHERAWPKGLEYRIVEGEENLWLWLFRENFDAFDGEDRYQIAMMVKETMEKIRGDGVPIYLNVEAGHGIGWRPGSEWDALSRTYVEPTT